MVGGRPWSVKLVRKNALFPIKTGRLSIAPMSLTLECQSCGAAVTSDARFCATCGRPVGVPMEERRVVTVLFADLVGFTALSQQIGTHELAAVVERFETIAYDTITEAGGRVVKMIGDEVMFAVGHERAAAEIALRLSETYRDDDELSDVRVGLASGPVLQREADLYGPVVNTASRIVGIAFPGTVVCAAPVREALAGDVDYSWKSIGSRNLKDIGRAQLYVLRRAADGERPRSSRQRAEARRAERREARVTEMEEQREKRPRRGRSAGRSR